MSPASPQGTAVLTASAYFEVWPGNTSSMKVTYDCYLPRATAWLAPMRKARWFKGLLLLAAICTVSLYCVEATHNHETPKEELHCPICQVVVHNALEVYSPTIAPHPLVPRVRFLVLEPQQSNLQGREWTVKFQSRAPPIV
jgi:hypothetical protein